MGEREKWLALGIDIERPSAARVYDYYLGGSTNFEADRELARRVTHAIPWTNEAARNNRAFLRRVVRYCVASGIRQFLDIGSGTPTVGNVHEVAQQAEPSCRVVYVDNDPVAVAHAEIQLADNPQAAILRADLRDPDTIFDDPRTRKIIDFSQPLAVLMVAVLPFIPDSDDPAGIIARCHEKMAPGSYLAISHGTDDVFPEKVHQLTALYADSPNPVVMRTRQGIIDLFAGFDLVGPGLVWTPQWLPETGGHVGERPEESMTYAGVGRKP